MNDETWNRLRAKYPWPETRPDVRPLAWSLDGGGRQLVVELIQRRGVRVILEIGVFLGGSARTWLAAAPDVVVVGVDPWAGSWANFARVNGFDDFAEQLDAPEGGYQTFLATMWEHRARFIPVRGTSPEKLYELHALGFAPDLVFLDSDKSGVELAVCLELFPRAILAGDDWTYGPDENYPIRKPVRRIADAAHLHLRTKMATWILDPQPPPLSYRLRSAWRKLRGRA